MVVKVVRGIVAILVGAVIGMAVNMSLVKLGPMLASPPEGIDITTMEGLIEALPLMKFKHYISPFLAHALGTLVGGFLAALIAVSYKDIFALVIGVFFLIGGIMMVKMLPNQPLAFIIIDLGLAYIPMAWIGAQLAKKIAK